MRIIMLLKLAFPESLITTLKIEPLNSNFFIHFFSRHSAQKSTVYFSHGNKTLFPNDSSLEIM